jgi:cytochrome c
MKGLGLLIAGAALMGAFVLAAAAHAAAADGAALFESRCAACHSLDPAAGKMGPPLRGVVGRKAGGLGGYAYSEGLRRAHLVWSPRSLDAFLTSPDAVAPGTKMPVSVADAAVRSVLIRYLEAQGRAGRGGARARRAK